MILLPGDESAWESSTQEHRDAVYARHDEFGKLLRERGHQVVGGAELTHSREAKLVRADAAGKVFISDGPFAESAEQLTGYYEVETNDLDDLLQVVGIVAGPDHDRAGMGGVEVRRVVSDEDRAASGQDAAGGA
ncbi:YciI family protein [Knoellia sinensis]|uniref:YciI family protein n=1 Tax=Knoellia sinensis TaxID=136100 RepID=UPI000A82DE75|nr:YciI family protein [Knoellia sinensis]